MLDEQNKQVDDFGRDDKLITETGSSFRDSVTNIDKTTGNRVWIYPTKPKGQLYFWRNISGVILLVILFGVPFLKFDGKPFLLIDLINRQFIIFGMAFWPQDFYIFALAFLALAVFIILFTAVLGRLWCGWLCPQTVFMELVFRRIEYLIEGDGPKQRLLDKAPISAEKIFKKTLKHVLFLIVSFVSVSFLSSYVVSADTVGKVLASPSAYPGGITAIIGLTIVFDLVFARFREQACIYVCPYARLQSVLIDKNSIVVAYNNNRGEPRGKLSKSADSSNGDCIDCAACVRVCPTGIDIRNGIQLECVNCAACIDACDEVMEKVKKPKKLIKYASLNQIETNTRFRVTPRIILYSVALVVLMTIVSVLLSTRSDVEATILRAKGTIFIENDNGTVSNLFTAKIANKTFRNIKFDIRLDDRVGAVRIVGNRDLTIGPDKLIEAAFFVDLPKSALVSSNTKIRLGVYSDGVRLYSLKTSFSGPAKYMK